MDKAIGDSFAMNRGGFIIKGEKKNNDSWVYFVTMIVSMKVNDFICNIFDIHYDIFKDKFSLSSLIVQILIFFAIYTPIHFICNMFFNIKKEKEYPDIHDYQSKDFNLRH